MAVVPGIMAKKSDSCPPVPASPPFAKLVPKKLTNGVKDCLLSCNITEVERTGVDPCHVGSLSTPSNSVMSCFNLGPGTMKDAGACGYNCTAFKGTGDKATRQPCRAADVKAGDCLIYCDTRSFPPATGLH